MSEPTEVYGVTELTYYIKHILEEDPVLQGIEVQGEVSNLTYHRSGHVYFSLKDKQAQLSCVMFKTQAQRNERIQEGDDIVITGDISVYVPRGSYQIIIQKIRKGGKGDLYQQFLMLKEKLKEEGLFDVRFKKPIPLIPRQIGVITSPTGAAVRDIVRTILRRYPAVTVKIFPAIVQGDGGAASIIRSLTQAQEELLDVIILARGGGSLEDLWNFNEETVARSIFASRIPVITGIGHETDFTIADFVADYRASTPTAAAEHAVPDQVALLQMLNEYKTQLQTGLQRFVDFKKQLLDDYTYRLHLAGKDLIQKKHHELNILRTKLEGMDITRLLDQGDSLTLKEGKIIQSIDNLVSGDEIDTVFSDGRVYSKVGKIESGKKN